MIGYKNEIRYRLIIGNRSTMTSFFLHWWRFSFYSEEMIICALSGTNSVSNLGLALLCLKLILKSFFPNVSKENCRYYNYSILYLKQTISSVKLWLFYFRSLSLSQWRDVKNKFSSTYSKISMEYRKFCSYYLHKNTIVSYMAIYMRAAQGKHRGRGALNSVINIFHSSCV